jgi:hypothetical protein
MVLFAAVIVSLIANSVGGPENLVVLARIVGGGILSPAALTVGVIAAIYVAVITGVRRLSLIGRSYQQLSVDSCAFGLLTDAGAGAKGKTPYLADVLDMPAQNLPAIYPLAVLLVLALAGLGMWHVSTIEGRTFSWFVRIGSLTALGVGLLLVAQGLATWITARSHLKRLARSRLEPHFTTIAPHVPWDISLAPPRLMELIPVARLADGVIRDFRTLALSGPYTRDDKEVRRRLDDFSPFRADAEERLGVRDDDMAELKPLFGPPLHTEILRLEMSTRQHAALIQSTTWFGLWRLSDALVALMEKTHWLRAKAVAAPAEVEEPAEVVAGAAAVGTRRAHLQLRRSSPESMPDAAERAAWFARGEQLVALQIAFVLRDIVARTITCLFAAMLCLTLLTASHLLYSFNGRASTLTIDLLAVAAAALSAVWILVDMERDHVLSRLKTTTPGRIDFNWDFMKRIGVYGVLPLLAVIAALFPEVGGTLFGWLEPIRRLSGF